MTVDVKLLDWTDALQAPSVVGGKAYQLAQLHQYGLPVPAGMIVPAEWSQRWLSANALQNTVDDAVSAALAGNPRHLHELAERLEYAAIPEVLSAAIQEALTARDWLDVPLVVRSSALEEDSRHASFAGIYHSSLNVRGAEALEKAIRKVWSSLWTPTAVTYRQHMDIPGYTSDAPAMAVLIMPLLPATASGIAFTCDPINGRDDRLIIHAQWGLGESLVSGQAAGDEYLFAEDPLDDHLWPIARKLGRKCKKTVPLATGGTESRATGSGEAAAFVLTPPQAMVLANLLRDAALALDFAMPCYDLEWVWDGQIFWLTQARPVTARARLTYPTLQEQPTYWSRGNTCEVVPDPLSPVDWSNSRKLVNALLEQGYAMASYPLLEGVQRAGLFHGRLYLELSLIQWEAYDALGVSPKAMNTLVGGHQPEIELAPPLLSDRLSRLARILRYLTLAPGRRRRADKAVGDAILQAKRWRQQALPQDGNGLKDVLIRWLRTVRGASDIFFLQGSSGGSLTFLVQQLEKHFPGEGYALATALLAGGVPSVTAQQGYELMALARLARTDSQVGPLPESAAASDDWFATIPPENEFRRAFTEFIERYGHRGLYETYLRNPRWREEPGYLLASLDQLASIDESALRERQRSAESRAKRRIVATVPFWWRPIIATLTRAARKECNQRESARSAVIAYLEPIRQVLLAAGAHLVAVDGLDRADDIFQLVMPEIFWALAGKIPSAGLRARVLARTEMFQSWLRETPPDVIVEDKHHQVQHGQAPESMRTERKGEPFQGVPTGTGIIRGKARLLRHPNEGHKLLPGEILVALSTDPGWTPLFLKAGGLVVETGGYLSHGAIVAREFGIPAVMNLPGVFLKLNDGDLLEVDGQKGTVICLECGDIH